MLSTLPLNFWSEAILKKIGDSLGVFRGIRKDCCEMAFQSVAKILVQMDLGLILPENVDNEVDGRNCLQILDYEGVPIQ